MGKRREATNRGRESENGNMERFGEKSAIEGGNKEDLSGNIREDTESINKELDNSFIGVNARIIQLVLKNLKKFIILKLLIFLKAEML
jgi:hypothetical protein